MHCIYKKSYIVQALSKNVSVNQMMSQLLLDLSCFLRKEDIILYNINGPTSALPKLDRENLVAHTWSKTGHEALCFMLSQAYSVRLCLLPFACWC